MIPKNLPQKKKTEHTLSGYSWITCCSFDASENKRSYYRGKDCMEMFCKDLRDQAMKIINYEKKEMIPLTDKETVSYEKQEVCYIYEKKNSIDKNDVNTSKLYHKARDH